MSDFTSHYMVRGKREVETQYSFLRSPLAKTMQRQGWMVEQISFVTVDEYANILKGMYSIRFEGRSDHGDTLVNPPNGRSDHVDTPVRPVWGPTSLLSTLSHPDSLKKLGNTRRKRKRRGNN